MNDLQQSWIKELKENTALVYKHNANVQKELNMRSVILSFPNDLGNANYNIWSIGFPVNFIEFDQNICCSRSNLIGIGGQIDEPTSHVCTNFHNSWSQTKEKNQLQKYDFLQISSMHSINLYVNWTKIWLNNFYFGWKKKWLICCGSANTIQIYSTFGSIQHMYLAASSMIEIE